MCPTLLPLSLLLLPDFPGKETCALMGAQREETVPALPSPPGPFLCLQTFQAMADRKRISSQRDLLAAVQHGVFPRRPVALVAPCLIVGFGSFRRKYSPSAFEVSARLIEGRSRSAALFAGIAARIEAAVPLPLRFGVRIADAPREICPTRTSPK